MCGFCGRLLLPLFDPQIAVEVLPDLHLHAAVNKQVLVVRIVLLVLLVRTGVVTAAFLIGFERGKARVERAKQLLDEIGLGGERLEMFFVSGGMGATFAHYAEEMTERVRALGPNPLRERDVEQTT